MLKHGNGFGKLFFYFCEESGKIVYTSLSAFSACVVGLCGSRAERLANLIMKYLPINLKYSSYFTRNEKFKTWHG